MTDLDELKALWAEHDRKLETCVRLNRRLLEDSSLARARSALGGLKRFIAIDLAGNVLALALLIAFAHAFPEPRFAVPALALAVGAIALTSGNIRQLLATRIDAGEPIARAQRQLEELRHLRLRCLRWTFLLAPLAWPPLAIIALKLLGVDAWVSPGLAWLAANLAFGIAVPVIAWALSVRYGARWRTSPLVTRLANTLSGRSLADAARALDAIADFEEE